MRSNMWFFSPFWERKHIITGLLWLALAGTGWAQLIPTGRVLGIVKDQSGAITPHAAITLTNAETGISRSTTSNARGEYLFPDVPAGRYRLVAVLKGFQQLTQELGVQSAVSTTVDLTLHVGSEVQTIQVSAPAPLLNTDSGTLATVVVSTQISNIPLQGRNALALVLLTPGVVQTTVPGNYALGRDATNAFGYFTSNGANFRTNDFMLDGSPDNLTDRPAYLPSVDLVQEISVITNSYDAQYGHGGGAEVMMTTKSGTNQLHGTAYNFLQNSFLNATNFFTNSKGLAKPQFRENMFGTTVGGPIRHDRTFFFATYEGLRAYTPATNIGTVPTAAQRNGDFSQTFASNGQLIQIYNPFSTAPDPNKPGQYIRQQFPGNIITPSTLINPASTGLLSLIPLPNGSGTINNFARTTNSTIVLNGISGRVDHEITQNNRLFGRLSWNKTTTNAGGFLLPGAANDVSQMSDGVLGWTSTLTPSTVLEVTASYQHYEHDTPQPVAQKPLGSLGFSSAFVSGVAPSIPSFSIADMSGFGYGTSGYDHDPTWGFNANMRHIRGRHNMKWGYQYQLKQDDSGSFGIGANFSFDRKFMQGSNPNTVSATSGYGIASFLLGTMSPTTASYASTPNIEATSSPYYGSYFQDDIRVSSRFTANLGVRWEAWQPANDRFNAQTIGFAFQTPNPIQAQAAANYALHPSPYISVDQFSSGILGGLLFATPSNRRYAPTVWNNFSPRIGFAYRLTDKTVLRGGFGYFYSMFYTSFAKQSGFSSQTPVTATINGITPVNLLDNPFPNGFIAPTGASMGLKTLLGTSVGFPNQTAHPQYNARWNFGVQRQLTPNTMLEVYYVGESSFHCTIGTPSQTAAFSSAGAAEADTQYVYLPAQYLSLGSTLQTTIPNPFVGLIPTSSTLGASTISIGNLLNRYPEFTGVDRSRQTDGLAFYHSLQVTATKRYSYGLTILGSYTWSKSLDDFRYINQQDPGPSKMISWYDAPQRITVSSVYQLPFGPGRRYGWKSGAGGKFIGGWQYSLQGLFQSGFPVFLSTPVVINAGVNPTLPRSQRSPNLWFNKAVFSVLPAYTLSSAPFGLNSLRADAIDNWDMSLIKDTNLTERFKLRFRWELFNSFNRPQFGSPNVNPSSSAYGTITSQANSPRAMQGALELIF